MIVRGSSTPYSLDELGVAAGGEAVDELVGDLVDARLERPHLGRREGPVDELALAHVVGRVGRQEDAHAAAHAA